MEIEKNRKGTKCGICRQFIKGEKRVCTGKGLVVRKYYHLTCFYNYAKRYVTHWTNIKDELSKYEDYMIVEKLT